MHKVNKHGKLPPCPDPERYVLIRSKEGDYWRRKRGTGVRATLNKDVQKNADNMSKASPAASRIVAALSPYMEGLEKGRVVAPISGRLLKCLNGQEEIVLKSIVGVDLQPAYPLKKVMRARYKVEVDEDKTQVRITIFPTIGAALYKLGKLVTGYNFTAVLLWGDAETDGELETAYVESETYKFGRIPHTVIMELPLPENTDNWVVALRADSYEDGEMALLPKTRGMAIIG